jgi:lipopolysaccharide/colanic/teichoic acid biosynthesis glycosyltransferase
MKIFRNLLFGIISGFLGFALSPQFKMSGVSNSEIWHVFNRSLLFAVCLASAAVINGHDYRMFIKSKIDFLVNTLISTCLGVGVAVFILYLFRYKYVGRWVLFYLVVFYLMLLWVESEIGSRWYCKNIYIIGSSISRFSSVAGAIGCCRVGRGIQIVETNLVKIDESIMAKLSENHTQYYLVPGDHCNLEDIRQRVMALGLNIARVFSVESVIERELEVVDIGSVSGRKWWNSEWRIQSNEVLLIKRFLDLVCACCLLVIAIPVMCICGAIIKIVDGGPIIYTQVRLGQYGKEFLIFKMRTMTVNSEVGGAQWAKVADPRVTRIGKLLRKTRVDELPQLWNIIKGDMSFVGPRPERPEFYTVIEREIPEFNIRLACKPGLTGWAQVNYPYGASVHDARVKLLYDLFYMKNASLVFDLRILSRTLVAMVRGSR